MSQAPGYLHNCVLWEPVVTHSLGRTPLEAAQLRLVLAAGNQHRVGADSVLNIATDILWQVSTNIAGVNEGCDIDHEGGGRVLCARLYQVCRVCCFTIPSAKGVRRFTAAICVRMLKKERHCLRLLRFTSMGMAQPYTGVVRQERCLQTQRSCRQYTQFSS